MNSTRTIMCLLAFFLLWIALSTADLDCDTHGGHTCSSDQKCIPFPFICDGEKDCTDGSDEQDCTTDSFECGEDDFKCQTHHQCIPVRWRCDGDQDCFDDSDEQNCDNVTCRDSHISCGPGQRCIDKTFLCDGHPDCPDESDELLEMCQNRTCHSDDFRCERTHRCIVGRWVCDGDNDCDDLSDERNCEAKKCGEEEWPCTGSRNVTMCITTAWRCDGSYDCADRSDELGCPSVSPSHHCYDNMFACHVGSECIHREWLCDLDWDCTDGSDELNCSTHTCGPNDFQCRDGGYCVPLSSKCDGVVQCADGSDELACESKTSCHMDTEFNCNRDGPGAAAFCISVDLLCDGRNDCGRFEDEDTRLCNRSIDNPCSQNNSGCAHKCVFTHVSHHCECHAGYRLLPDGKGCEDIDECAFNNTCSHGCENKKGSFKCSCKSGYLLDPYNHINCLATGDEPELMFTSFHEVRLISVRSGGYHTALQGPVNAMFIDYDFATSTVFYSVKNLGSIHWSNRNDTRQAPRRLTDNIPDIGGLAFDWIHRNLYWTDSSRRTVEVMSLAGGTATDTWQRTLISTDLEEPKSIIVDPRNNNRMLYWSDCGSQRPKIERSYLDGSQASRQPLVTRGIVCPNSLTLDYETDTLYWVDMKVHTVVGFDLVSQRRTLLLTSFTYLGHPVALTTFEDYVYWADAKTDSLFKMSKLRNVTGENAVTRVAGHLKTLTDVDVFHRLRQPTASNACSSRTCSHICLPVPSNPGYVCACPNDNSTMQYNLDSKGFTCLVTQNSAPDVPEGSSNSSGLSQPDKVTMKEMDIGRVIGAVIGSLCAAVFLLTACLWVVRKYRRRNIKSLKFDNPVYRAKAEEDQFSISNEQNRPSSVFPASSEPLNSSTEHIVTSEQL